MAEHSGRRSGPRIRSVKPEMYADERVGRLSRHARLLWTVGITMSDDEGRFRALPGAIIGHGYPYGDATAEEVERWLAEVEEAGLIVRYEHDGVPYVWIRGFVRHQKIDRPTPSSLPAPPGSANDRGGLAESSPRTRRGLAEDSTPDQDQDQDQDLSSSSAVPADPEIVLLSHLLADLIRERDPRARVAPQSKRWLTDMRLLLRDREGDEEEVERVLRWSQDDPFWQSNILSPGSLRAKFSRLRGQSQRPAANSRGSGKASERGRRADALRRVQGLPAREAEREEATT